MAGQLLNSLKSAEKPLSALSHETRLGMAVITILFCAFCFLVYHKMDLHEKQRQLASIQPNGAGSEATPDENAAETVATVSSQSTDIPAETVDPLISRDDLSQGSPFADDSMTAAESQAGSVPGLLEQNAPNESLLALAEPTEAAQMDQSTPAAAEESSMPAFDALGSSPLEEPTQQNIQDNFQSETSSGMMEVAANANSNSATSTPDETPSLGFSEPTEPTLSEISPTASSDEPPAFAALDETPALKPAESEAPKPMEEVVSAEPSSSSGEAADPFADATESTAMAEEPTEKNKEPVLIAMAEPQGQQDGFSGGFSPDGFAAEESTSGVTPGRAPVSEPQDSFSSFDAEPTQPKNTASTPSNTFGGGGFNAVTQPGGRTSSNIRTAAGSGAEADGKFSLAAFNYQNTNVEAAPDDGSTFESIKVQNGDNYSKISKRVYGTTRYFSALAVFNQHRIPEPKNMRPGMIVLTPPAEVLEQRYPQLFEDMKPRVPEPAEFLELEDGSPAYRVGERETLSEISERFLGRSSRWVEIYRMNQTIVQDPNRLKPGIILALPADATEVHVSP